MLRMEFEPTTPVFERAKTINALDRAATVIRSIHPNRPICLLLIFGISIENFRKRNVFPLGSI
jgi:hypothetical protein